MISRLVRGEVPNRKKAARPPLISSSLVPSHTYNRDRCHVGLASRDDNGTESAAFDPGVIMRTSRRLIGTRSQ